jgi:glyoxylase-like metal-dependent hydrolase (beta-lactamase superfamily II)
MPDLVADDVWRLGDRYVNYYLLRSGGKFVLIDSGLPAHRPQLDVALAAIGAAIDKVDAVVLTHSHPDHAGTAEAVRSRSRAPVRVHSADRQALIGTGYPPPVKYFLQAWRPFVFGYIRHLIANGITKVPPVAEARSFEDGEVLDIPGRPRVVHAPGHTPGACALYFESAGLVFTGDALVTLNGITGRPGPCLSPAGTNHDYKQAIASLGALDGIVAGTVLPGHGEPWRDGLRSALEIVRARTR